MSAPDPESSGILAHILQWAWAGVLALGGIVFKGIKDDIRQSKEIEAKLFDEIAKVRVDMNKNHVDLLNAIHEAKK